jgi:hypothetical protein
MDLTKKRKLTKLDKLKLRIYLFVLIRTANRKSDFWFNFWCNINDWMVDNEWDCGLVEQTESIIKVCVQNMEDLDEENSTKISGSFEVI